MTSAPDRRRGTEAAGSSTAPALLTIEDEVATITLNRPERLNAVDVAMAETLRDVGLDVASRDAVRVIVVKGAGAAFCAGGDSTCSRPTSARSSRW